MVISLFGMTKQPLHCVNIRRCIRAKSAEEGLFALLYKVISSLICFNMRGTRLLESTFNINSSKSSFVNTCTDRLHCECIFHQCECVFYINKLPVISQWRSLIYNLNCLYLSCRSKLNSCWGLVSIEMFSFSWRTWQIDATLGAQLERLRA